MPAGRGTTRTGRWKRCAESIVPRFLTYRKTHGGLNFPIDFPWRGSSPAPADAALRELWFNHDRIQRVDYLNGGVGLAWAFNERYALTMDYLVTLWGENGHEIHNAVSLSVYRGF